MVAKEGGKESTEEIWVMEMESDAGEGRSEGGREIKDEMGRKKSKIFREREEKDKNIE